MYDSHQHLPKRLQHGLIGSDFVFVALHITGLIAFVGSGYSLLDYLKITAAALESMVSRAIAWIIRDTPNRASTVVLPLRHSRSRTNSGVQGEAEPLLATTTTSTAEEASESQPLQAPEESSESEDREVDEARSVCRKSESCASMMSPLLPTRLKEQIDIQEPFPTPLSPSQLPPGGSPALVGRGHDVVTGLNQQVTAPSAIRHSTISVSATAERAMLGDNGSGGVGGGTSGSGMVISWENLSVRVRLGRGRVRYILQSVSGISGPAPALPSKHARQSGKVGELFASEAQQPSVSESPAPCAAGIAGVSPSARAAPTSALGSTVVHVGWPGVSPSSATAASVGQLGGSDVHGRTFVDCGAFFDDKTDAATAPGVVSGTAVQPLSMAPPTAITEPPPGGLRSLWGLSPLSRFGFRHGSVGSVGAGNGTHLGDAETAVLQTGTGNSGGAAWPSSRCCLFAIVGPSGAGA